MTHRLTILAVLGVLAGNGAEKPKPATSERYDYGTHTQVAMSQTEQVPGSSGVSPGSVKAAVR